MAIIVACKCGKQYRVRDDFAGQTAKCSCGNTVQIPKPSSIEGLPEMESSLPLYSPPESLVAKPAIPLPEQPLHIAQPARATVGLQQKQDKMAKRPRRMWAWLLMGTGVVVVVAGVGFVLHSYLESVPSRTIYVPAPTPMPPQVSPASPQQTAVLPTPSASTPSMIGPSSTPLVIGPWEIEVLSFEQVPTYMPSLLGAGGLTTLTPKPPADKIALVTIRGKPGRTMTETEKGRIRTNLNSPGDLGTFALMLDQAYKSKGIIFNHAFALTSLSNPRDLSYGMCQLMECSGGLVISTTFGKEHTPHTCLGFATGGEFRITLIFAHRSNERTPLLVFMPFGDLKDIGAALLNLDAPGGLSVRYGDIDSLVKGRASLK